MMPYPSALRYLMLLALAAAIPACKKDHADPQIPADADSITIVRKVLEPIILDSAQISTLLAQYPLFDYHSEEIHTFYKNRGNRSAWFNAYGLIEQAGYFMNQLEHFDDEGLKDSVIYYNDLKKLHTTIADPNYIYTDNDPLLVKFECMLTAEFFVYAQKVWYGISEKTTRSLDWYVTRKTVPSVSILDSILSGGTNAFTAYEPLYPQYALLKPALKKYKSLSDEPWDSIFLPAGLKSIKPGEQHTVLTEIKRRLFLLGDLIVADSSTLYDSTTLIAAQLFQDRHGLLADGVLGEKFFREINCTPADRAKQIALNMERCRWLPKQPAGNYIMVNIPEYTMRIYEADTLAWQMRVVVGKSSTGTTIFNDELEYIVFSPYWTPPASIRDNEILPALKKDPDYLKKQQMEAFSPATGQVIDVTGVDWNKYHSLPYMVRQRPGNSNALGWVKFIFPNEHSIYFHDTPSRQLFSREARGFSHGCIRIEKPKELATYLLRDDSTYTPKVIDSLYYLGRETHVRLKEKVPVYIVYFTARVAPDGSLHFSRDIYGHDAKLEKTLYPE